MNASESGLYNKLMLMRTMRSACNAYNSICNQYLVSIGLTEIQGEILLYLLQKPSTMIETEELLQAFPISAPSMSGILKKLKQKGYIRYSMHEENMRKKRISLTIKALDIESQLTRIMEYLENTVYYQLADSKCEEVYHFLCIMLQNISNLSSKEENLR